MPRKRLPCTIDGVHYESEKVPSSALGIVVGTLRRRFLSSNFPNYISKHHPKKTIKRKFFVCTIDGIEYRSVTFASRKLKLSCNAIRHRLASFDYPEYVCPYIAKEPSRTGHGEDQKPCSINGVDYASIKAAAEAFGMTIMGLRTRLLSSNFPEYISKHHPKIQRKKASVRCSIGGVEYASIAEAARKFKISHTAVVNRLESCNYPDYVCDAIPKKSPKSSKYSYMVNGRKYSTLQEIADIEEVSKERIRQKMNNPSYKEYKRFERT